MGPEMLVPILVPLGFFAMVFGIVYLYKKENLAMIERGMNPKQISDRPVPYKNLKWGLLLVGSGIGLVLAYLINVYVTKDDNPAIWFGLLAIGGGLGLIRSYSVEKNELVNKPAKLEEAGY
jgi:hypothetical protein